MGQLHFYKITDTDTIARRIARNIKAKMAEGKDVLWLLSGGSAIPIACAAAELLKKTDVSRLTVGQIDERFGIPGHHDSNWRQLESAGFGLPQARLMPILTGKDIVRTTQNYDRFISDAEQSGNYIIGLLGIGADGHTAGILPNSAALSSDKYVDYYQSSDFKRITLTGRGLELLDEAAVYAAGPSKTGALADLSKRLNPDEQPAQLLKRITTVDVYNDVIGGNI